MIRIVDVRKLRTPEQRAAVCYVGRTFAGWPASRWMNPFRVVDGDIEGCLSRFREYAAGCMRGGNLTDWLGDLWEECQHGNKPLGCWCINATHGDGQPVRCHAQVLAALLHARFVESARV